MKILVGVDRKESKSGYSVSRYGYPGVEDDVFYVVHFNDGANPVREITLTQDDMTWLAKLIEGALARYAGAIITKGAGDNETNL